MLKDKILNKESGLIFYGLTPPKTNTEPDKIQAIANKQMERLHGIDIDALILYDIQDESARTDVPRPFPFMSTLAPDVYEASYLQDLKVPKITYKSVGKYPEEEFRNWTTNLSPSVGANVFVGVPTPDHKPTLTLADAYRIKKEINPELPLGAVTIPERHVVLKDEPQRMFFKIDNGVSFFVSQCVYSVNNTKDLLSDYYYASKEANRELVPIILTLTPCGSIKTLEFMEWLGVHVPPWLKNELKHSEDILSKSIDICKRIASEIIEFAAAKNIPIGFNIESVSIRKEEIEASIELLKDIKAMMQNR
ncbi:MAG: methylenetetrahydrofolate reductase [Flavobacteriales bacterium]|nr:methylenetetrahydrofolate reductase [Flavobacteriales bacterium]